MEKGFSGGACDAEDNRQIDALVYLKEEICSAIEKLPGDTEKNEPEMYYPENKSFLHIGKELEYYPGSVRRIVAAAVKKSEFRESRYS